MSEYTFWVRFGHEEAHYPTAIRVARNFIALDRAGRGKTSARRFLWRC